MADFIPAFNHTVGIEGGYANDKDDRGGETFCGISRKFHPDWAGWEYLDRYSVAEKRKLKLQDNLSLFGLVREFYRQEFWNRLNLDAANSQAIAAEAFDTAVNCGIKKSAEILQRSLNMVGGYPGRHVNVDCSIGPKTLQAVNACGYPDALLKCMNGFQFVHYYDIVKDDISQRKWFRGWLRRVWENHPE